MGWGHSDVDINIDNNFNRINNINGGNRVNVDGKWQHNPQHRGGAPYADRPTADKYGGTARGDSLSTRQTSAARQQRADPVSAGNMSTGISDRGTGISQSNGPSTLDRGGMDRGAGLDAGYTDTLGDQRSGDLGASSRASSGFSGGSAGYSGASARASSSRGQASMGARGGGRRR
jgi:hypothetical protein